MAESRRSDAILTRLMGLHPKVIDLTLDRVYRLLDKLGNPQTKLPPVVHVAGTNGKGSTIAFMRSILTEAGYKTHVYTSPHLVRFAERITLAGQTIQETDLSEYLERCEQANAGEPITYFEITTCAALLAYSEVDADILLLEVGLGGRLDATNVIETPLCTVITPVSIDHQQFLGSTLSAIAAEKAAIQKAAVPSVVAPQWPDCAAVIERTAHDTGAQLYHAQPLPSDRDLGLRGDHQRINAGVATTVTQILRRSGFTISPAAESEGLRNANWPARMQQLTSGPIFDRLTDDWEVWLDGGHNAAAGEILADYAQANWNDRPLHLIVGMLNTKAVDQFLKPLATVAVDACAIPIPGEPNSLSATDLQVIADAQGLPCGTATDLEAAVSQLCGDDAGRLLICGSLYLAGEVLSNHA